MKSAWLLLPVLTAIGWAANPPEAFFETYCLDCHDAATEKGDLNLEDLARTFEKPETERTWMRVLQAVDDEIMPPPGKQQPEAKARQAAVRDLHAFLAKHSRTGGSVIRRLNKVDYERSVRAALGVPFSVSPAFPADQEYHGFDNAAEGLILSPPVMEQYVEHAVEAADLLLPPPVDSREVNPERIDVEPESFSMNFEASQLVDGVLRLVSRNDILVRSCSWPTRFEARHTGTYRIETRLSAFKPTNGLPLRVELL
ncbi:MAG: DUF1587 domain-containing protein, partial [Verrucomicrobiota bacterium]